VASEALESFEASLDVGFRAWSVSVKVVLLDGGTSLELQNRSSNKAPLHWSAEYLMSEPDLVRQVHLDYILAGSKVITVNSYSSTYTRMEMVGAADSVPELQRIACELALEARDRAGAAGADVAIAGCIPPLNGTYRPDRVREFETNHDEYTRLGELQAPNVDLFICETMSTSEESRAAAAAMKQFGKAIWVGWSLMDTGPWLRSAESVATAARALSGLRVDAVLANCCSPESITASMPALKATGFATGGYANGFTKVPATFMPGKTKEQLKTRRDLDPAAYSAFALNWIEQGATIVGGCCEVGPAHIACLRDNLLAAGHDIVSPSAIDWPERV
jgi:S-methylmethionine-dependent homocysteine/selenocysteine methylase